MSLPNYLVYLWYIWRIFGRSRSPARAVIYLVQLGIGIVPLIIRVVFLPLPLPRPFPYYLYNAPKVAVYASLKGSILATTFGVFWLLPLVFGC